MLPVKLYELNYVEDKEITRVVIVSKYKDKYIFCKHKERNTLEIPGGHVEENETWIQTAKRELYEETGATKINIKPICLYKISKYGLLCYAEILKLEDIPKTSEIEKIEFSTSLPKNLTYKEAHTLFFNKVINQIEGV